MALLPPTTRQLALVSPPLRIDAVRDVPRSTESSSSIVPKPACYRVGVVDALNRAVPWRIVARRVVINGRSRNVSSIADAFAPALICGVTGRYRAGRSERFETSFATASLELAGWPTPVVLRVMNATEGIDAKAYALCTGARLSNVSVVEPSSCQRTARGVRSIAINCSAPVEVRATVRASQLVAFEVGDVSCGVTTVRNVGNLTTAIRLRKDMTIFGTNCSWDGNRRPLDALNSNRTVRALLKGGIVAEPATTTPVDVRFAEDIELPPELLGVQGCLTDAYPQAFDCPPGGTLKVTVVGRRFDRFNATTLNATVYPSNWDPLPCTKVAVIDSTTLTCVVTIGFGQNGVVNVSGQYRVSGGIFRSIRLSSAPRGMLHFVAGNERFCERHPTTRVLCSGLAHGRCDPGSGACECVGDPVNSTGAALTGVFSGSACDVCHLAFTGDANLPDGVACTRRCPGSGDGTTACNGHGVCWDGVCVSCYSGYAGATCDIVCPAFANVPCGGHGTCRRSDGLCDCFSNDTHGYFTGTVCTKCDAQYSGSSCTLRCPAVNGVICGGRGVCADGECVCPAGRCGVVCEIAGPDCVSCPDGYWGSTCQRECRGGASNPCSRHGLCRGGRKGDGVCMCDVGYATTTCAVLCPGGSSNPCGGHGTCSDTVGTCTCEPFYGRPDCSMQCPGLNANRTIACSGRGSCSQTSQGTGLCTCDLGYTGVACDLICPGGLVTPCSLHGICENNGTCTCAHKNSTGYWAGATCDACAYGFTGSGVQGRVPARGRISACLRRPRDVHHRASMQVLRGQHWRPLDGHAVQPVFTGILRPELRRRMSRLRLQRLQWPRHVRGRDVRQRRVHLRSTVGSERDVGRRCVRRVPRVILGLGMRRAVPRQCHGLRRSRRVQRRNRRHGCVHMRA
jgi:hypothetical protein